MKNITISVPEEVARWARVHAAERDMSVSRMVSEMLRERMAQDRAYEEAMKAFFELPGYPLKATSGYPKREELYDRTVVRGRERAGVQP